MNKSNHLNKFIAAGVLLIFVFFLSLEKIGLKKNTATEFSMINDTVSNHISESLDEEYNEDVQADIREDSYAGLLETTMSAYRLTGILTSENTFDNIAIINGARYKAGDYLPAFESDFRILSILEDKVIIHGALIVAETEEHTYELKLEHEKMLYVEPPVEAEAPLDWLNEQAAQES